MENIEKKVFDLRKDVLDMIMRAKAGHIGGDFSALDILAVLYLKQMNINVDNPEDPNRDYFILSKGHSVEAYYAVLAEKGFFEKKTMLEEFSAFGTQFIGHPNNAIPGIEMNSGSLGHGLPVCVGIALAKRMDGSDSRIYTLVGDGELGEGSVWEGFMAGGHYMLDNLCAVIDRNKLQISGSTEKIMTQEKLENRIQSFNWYTIQVNGNDVQELNGAFNQAKKNKGKPTCIIANTIKGYGGGDIMENKAQWHHRVPTGDEYEVIVEELMKRKEKR